MVLGVLDTRASALTISLLGAPVLLLVTAHVTRCGLDARTASGARH